MGHRPTVAAVCGLLFLVLTMPGARARPEVATGPPRIIVGSNEDSVALPGGNTTATIASMHLPTGVWVVIAKLYVAKVAMDNNLDTSASCQLLSGQASDETALQLSNSANGDPSNLPMELSIEVDVAATVGQAALINCHDDSFNNGDVEARAIQLAAIKAGHLTVVDMSGKHGPKSFGRAGAVPNIVYGEGGSIGGVAPGTTFVTVAKLALPTGRWSILGIVNLTNEPTDRGGALARCAVVAGTSTDESDADLGDATVGEGSQEVATFGLGQVFSSPQGGLVQLRCRVEGTNGVKVKTDGIRLIATHAGRLTLVPLGGSGSPSSFGPPSAIPRIVSGFESGPVPVPTGNGGPPPSPVIASLHLSGGSWWIVAKAWVENVSTSSLDMECDLVGGGFLDQVLVTLPAHFSPISQVPVPLSGAPTFTSSTGGRVKVKCDTSGNTGDAQAHSINITAIRAGTLTRVNI